MILIAVSGGIDSVCLAHKVRQTGGPFAIAHCNFHLRGEESNGDEAFVRALASSWGVTCHVKSFDTQAYAASRHISIEMAARELRYRWFGELCQENGYTALAVAHNANDNAETLLLNLLRGTGIKGISGMKEESFIPDPLYSEIPLLRPLLPLTREEIEAYAKENGLSWREDSTNGLCDYKRNKIRNLVFPVFKEINPRFVQTLNEDMARFSLLSALIPDIPETEETQEEIPEPPKEYIIKEESWDGSTSPIMPKGELILDADKAGEVIESHWESGDWIVPLGAPGRKKLQDWFTDHHIKKEEKHGLLLLRKASDLHHILAVAGYCIDNSVRVTPATRRVLRILPR